MHVSGLLCLRHCVPLHINVVENEDSTDDTSECVAQQIMAEVKALPKQRNYDLSSFTVSSTVKETSKTLLSLVSNLVSGGKITRVSLSLACAIQYYISKCYNQITLDVGVKFHHCFGSKEAVALQHKYRFSVTYDEVMRFRTSVAKYSANQSVVQGLNPHGLPVSSRFDSYDLNIFTPNGKRESHAMAIEFMQQQQVDLNRAQSDLEPKRVVERVTKAEAKSVKLCKLSAIPIHHSQGKEQPTPSDIRIHEGLSLADVQAVNASVQSALEACLLYTSPSPRDRTRSRMPSSA